MVKFVMAVAVAVSMAGKVDAEAWGLKMGMTKAEVSEALGNTPKEIPGTPFGFAVSEATDRSGEWKYRVTALSIHPVYGLCQFVVWKTVKTNGYGTQVKDAYESARSHLTAKYGEPHTFERLMPRSLWNRSQYFMMGLVKGDRFHISEWPKPTRKGVNGEFLTIHLEIKADTSDKGRVVIRYFGHNFPAMEQERKAKQGQDF